MRYKNLDKFIDTMLNVVNKKIEKYNSMERDIALRAYRSALEDVKEYIEGENK